MYQLYSDYFLWLCQLHPSLLHTDARPVFELATVEEAFSDFRGKISESGFFFRLIDPSYTIGAVGGFTFKRKQGDFIIGKKIAVRSNAASAKIIARNQCETICDDFIAHMLKDSQNGHPLFSNNQDELSQLNINVAPVLKIGDGTFDGMRCSFDFFPAKSYNLDCHPVPAWQQLSPTEYDGTPPDTDYGGFWQLNDGGNWQGN